MKMLVIIGDGWHQLPPLSAQRLKQQQSISSINCSVGQSRIGLDDFALSAIATALLWLGQS
jgi:hypothetical protein